MGHSNRQALEEFGAYLKQALVERKHLSESYLLCLTAIEQTPYLTLEERARAEQHLADVEHTISLFDRQHFRCLHALAAAEASMFDYYPL